MMIRASVERCLVVVACVGVMAGCASKLDTTRDRVDEGSFGNVVMTLVCKRMAYLHDRSDGDGRVDVSGDEYRGLCRSNAPAPDHAPAELKALQASRAELAAGIDLMLPAEILDDVQAYVTGDEFLRLYDDGTASDAVTALAHLLSTLGNDDDSLRALERIGHRSGYRPLQSAQGALDVLLSSPSLPDVLLHTTRQIAPGGAGHDALTDLVRALSVTLRNAEPATSAQDRLAPLVLDLLFRERPHLGGSRVMPLVLRDERGIASVTAMPTGELIAPFADADGDGLADTDELSRFVDASGALLAAPTPFRTADDPDPAWVQRDGLEQAIDEITGLPVYRYIDLDRTLFAALGREAKAIMDPAVGAGVDALHGMTALVGPRQAARRSYVGGERIDYTGFDLEQSALLDLMYGYLLMLGDLRVYDTLGLVRAMLVDHEPALAQLAEALVDAARVADGLPDVALEPGSPIFDELVPVVREILATPGLFEDLVVAMEDPRVAELGARFRDFMSYRDVFSYDPITQEVVGSFSSEVDRGAGNSGTNRSIWQRVLHLLDDVSGVELCNEMVDPYEIDLGAIVVAKGYAPCALLRVEDLAVFFVRSMAYARNADGDFIYDAEGRPVHAARLELDWDDALLEAAVTDRVIEIASGIEGFGHNPTPEALGRALFLDPPSMLVTTLIAPRTRHGELVAEVHAGTLPAWELNGFYEQVQPIVQPFVDHGQESLFIQLLLVLHRHWPARDSADHQQSDEDGPGYAWAANVAAYEPIIAEMLGRGHLLRALVAAAPTLRTMRVNDRSGVEILRDAVDYFLAPQVGLTRRDGSSTTTTADGKPVQRLSIWHVVADAYQRKRELMAADPGRAAAWERGFSGLIDALGRGEEDPVTGWRFRNPRLRGVGLALVDFLEERLRAQDAQANRALWLMRELPQDTADLVGSPVFAALVDVIAAIHGDAQARQALEALVSGVMDEATHPAAFRGFLAAAADLVQLAALDDQEMVPLVRALGQALDPELGHVDALLAFALGAREAELDGAESTLVRVLRNGVTEHAPGRTPLLDIIDGIAEIHRARPYEDLDVAFTRDDYRAMLQGVATFLDDEKYGLRKFMAVIESRNVE